MSRVCGFEASRLFAVALTALLGELFGAFADSAESFVPYFDTTLERLQHGLGSYLLAASGIAFVGFAVHTAAALLGAQAPANEAHLPGLIAAVFAGLLGVAAAALATVSLSIGFGQITGDPGIRAGQDLLPQLGMWFNRPRGFHCGVIDLVTGQACVADGDLAVLGEDQRLCSGGPSAGQLRIRCRCSFCRSGS